VPLKVVSWLIFQLTNQLLVVIGYTFLKQETMVTLFSTNPVWWPKIYKQIYG